MEKQLPYKPSMLRALIGLAIFFFIVKFEYNWTFSKELAVVLIPMISYFWAYHPVFISINKIAGKWSFSFSKGWD